MAEYASLWDWARRKGVSEDTGAEAGESAGLQPGLQR